MGIVLLVAGEAILRGGSEAGESQSTVVTFLAAYYRVFARELECKIRVAELFAEPIDSVMAAQAALSIGDQVSLHEVHIYLTMASHAGFLVEALDVDRVAVPARERRPVAVGHMALQ